MTHKSTQPAHALLDAWELLKRYRWRFIVPAFALSAIALAVSLFVPRVYNSNATFERRHQTVVTDLAATPTGRTARESRAAVLNEIKNPAAIDRVIGEISPELFEAGLVNSPADIAQLRFEIARHSSVVFEFSDSERDVVRVAFKSGHPRIAQLVVQGLVNDYIASQRQHLEARMDQSAGFFRSEVTRQREIIRGLEGKLLDFELKHARLLPDSPSNITEALYLARQAVDDALTERNIADARVTSLEQALAEEPTHVETLVNAKNPDLERLEGERRAALDRINEYVDVLKMRELHPDLVAARKQLAKVEEAIAAAPREVLAERQTITNPKRGELELQLTEARATAGALAERGVRLEQRLADLQAESDRVYLIRGQYRSIEREAEEAQRQLAFWEDNLRNSELAQTAEAGNMGVQLNVLQPASRAVLPVSPDLGQVIVIALLLGLVGGTLNVLVAHRNNETFLDGEKAAETVNLPIFGCVNELVTAQHKRMRHVRNTVIYPMNAAAIVLVLASLVGLLYADLRRPDLLDRWFGLNRAAAAVDAGASASSADDRPEPAAMPYINPNYTPAPIEAQVPATPTNTNTNAPTNPARSAHAGPTE
ncbi:MAG: hypothetical protein AAF823_07570 [Planctomycetota bacterium]